MLQVNKRVNLYNLFTGLGRILPCVVLLLLTSNGYAQTITKTASPTVQVPATVGKITKWSGDKNGAGILGDSVITESPGGNIGVGTPSPSSKLDVAGAITASGNINSAATVNAATLSVTGNATVGGTVSGNIVNANTQYNIGGVHILSNPGSLNLFAGSDAGQNNASGNRNAFFGAQAGKENTTGNQNAFFGWNAGRQNTTGRANSFFGGHDTGLLNTTGGGNSFFGFETGQNNTTGSENSFFGLQAGDANTTGNENTFIGENAGFHNIDGSDNTLIGFNADVLSGSLNHATAIGADAKVLFSNFIVIGRGLGEDTVQIPGDLIVGGSVSKGSGSFRIDHPLDPANKTLSHSFVESPDMMNIYNGNVTTDAKGEAQVSLPIYFAALNRDFRYQLTVIGQFAQAIVAREIKDNNFTIKTDKPNVKVSWLVTGIRQDAFANANRIKIEEDKGKQRGTYLHPELYNSASARMPGITPR